MPIAVDSKTPKEKKDEWRTPLPLFNVLNDEFKFQLDASANSANKLCPLYITKEHNALEQPWGTACGRVSRAFCNPPFSLAKAFLTKGLWEYNNGGVESVFLIRGDGYETAWFRQLMKQTIPLGPYLRELQFHVRQLWPRVPYMLPDGTKPKHGPNFPSALVIMVKQYKAGMFWYNWKLEAKERGYLK